MAENPTFTHEGLSKAVLEEIAALRSKLHPQVLESNIAFAMRKVGERGVPTARDLRTARHTLQLSAEQVATLVNYIQLVDVLMKSISPPEE